MPTNYAADSVWGSDYQRALASGDQAYLAKVQRAIDSRQQVAPAVGTIAAKTADMGRGTNVGMGGGNGYEYNTQGQWRTPSQGAFNTIYGVNGYTVNPGQWQGSGTVGPFDPTPTTPYTPGVRPPTQGQSIPPAPWGGNGFGPSVQPQRANAYQTGMKSVGLGGGLIGGMAQPQWNFGNSTMGNETHGQYQNGYNRPQFGQQGYASPYQTGYRGLLG